MGPLRLLLFRRRNWRWVRRQRVDFTQLDHRRGSASVGSGLRHAVADTDDPPADPCRPLSRQVRAHEKPFVPWFRTRRQARPTNAPMTITSTCLVFVVLLMGPLEVCAQQTIFNVPGTDVLDTGKVYVELNVAFKPQNDPSNVFPRFFLCTSPCHGRR